MRQSQGTEGGENAPIAAISGPEKAGAMGRVCGPVGF